MPRSLRARRPLRSWWLAGIIGAGMCGGCATQPTAESTPLVVTAACSPPVEAAGEGQDAWRQAEAFAATLPEAEVLVGRGDSMLPLYQDRTVLVVQRLALRDLRAGMTVVFIGDQGRPVAHTLVNKTPGGWVAMGLGNREPDRTRVRLANYLGTVVKAFVPSDRRQVVAAAEVRARALAANVVRVARWED